MCTYVHVLVFVRADGAHGRAPGDIFIGKEEERASPQESDDLAPTSHATGSNTQQFHQNCLTSL